MPAVTDLVEAMKTRQREENEKKFHTILNCTEEVDYYTSNHLWPI